MRFGSQLHRRRIPAWTESYVDYDRLKALVDAVPPLQGYGASDLKDAIHAEVDIVDDFLNTQDRFIETQILALNEHWGIRIGSTENSKYHGVLKAELEDLKASLLGIADSISQSQHYTKVNHDGISRILAKAAVKFTSDEVADISVAPRLARHSKSYAHGPWLPRVNATLQLIRETLEKEETDDPPRSLLLERSGLQRFPAGTIDFIRKDDALSLESTLNEKYPDSSTERQWALARLVQVATVQRAAACQRRILPNLRSGPNDEKSPKRHDYLHTIIQQLGRADPPLDSGLAAEAFHQILKLLHSSQAQSLQSQDALGRLPLHYAALLGLDGVCREIIAAVRDTSYAKSSAQLLVSLDVFRLTPMDYAIHRGNTASVKLLIEEYKSLAHADEPLVVEMLDILATATASEFTEISQQLIKEGWGGRFVDRYGKTVLHIAAEHGLACLVDGIVALGVDVNTQDCARGWTPLTAASVQGHTDTVEALLRAGASVEIRDRRGWLAKDHAAYRGHMKIVNAIKPEGSSILHLKPGQQLGASNILPERSPSESVIFVHLGTLDLNKNAQSIDLTPYRRHISPVQVPDTSLELSISIVGQSDGHSMSLPILSENSDWPWVFTTADPNGTAVVLGITSFLEATPVGTGVALVGSLTNALGGNRDTLIRDYSVPLVNNKLGHVGTVVLTVLVARPYNGPHPASRGSQTLELEPRSALGGHRGNGQNDNLSCLQIGENTTQSFLTAMDLGADMVELDVQLTKDNVAVVYHDFLVSEKGSDAPMHTLTLDQFMAISDAQSISTLPGVPDQRLPWDKRQRPRTVPRLRRRSLCAPPNSTTDALVKQMEQTLNYPGYKPNLRHHSVHEPFITLSQLYLELPGDIPLDIELKYPMLYEAADFQMDNYATEINLFLDTILSVTFAQAGRRRIIFTSFSPEVCMVMAVKQQKYPVLFLNDSSNWPTGDMRATSLQTAKRLANRFGLDGVVMSSEPFVHSPGTVGLVRRQGLYTGTYGPLNDDAASVEIQAKAGVDLIIVNKVKRMRQVLDKARAGK